MEFANTEEQNFKQETVDEVGKLNSVGIDQPTFEKIKTETEIEQDLKNVNQEAEERINQTRLLVDNPTQTLSNIDHEVLFVNKQENDGLVGSEGKENLTKIRNGVYKESDDLIPNFSQKMSEIDEKYENQLSDLKNKSQVLENDLKEFNLITEELRSRLINEKESLSDEEYQKLYSELHQRFDKQKEIDSKLALLWEQRLKMPLDKKVEKESFLLQVKDKTENEPLVTEQIIEKPIENLPIDTEYNETLLLGKKLSDFPEAVQEKYKASVEKYSSGLNFGMQEKDKDGLTLVDKTKNNIRNEYNDVMEKLGIMSSPAGASDNWIYWDLGKQSYLSQNPNESSENYNLSNPFGSENQEIISDITNRHVGWEILGYAKNNPDFVNTLDKNKDSYNKITSLLNKNQQNGKLHSYELSELGKLIQENRGIE